MKTRPNLVNFILLVGSGLFVQLAGSIYRIWLARTIGSEGLGILQMIYPVYRLLSGVATIGLPLALTKWVAEYIAGGQSVKINPLKKWAARIVFWLSLLIAGLLLISAPFLSRSVFTDPRIQEALIIVAFAIPFSALSAIHRGYFQGFSRMAPTAASEITEQIMEIASTVLLVEAFTKLMPFSNYAAPVFGLTLGEVTCLLTLLVFLKRYTPGPAFYDQTAEPVPLPHSQIFRYSWPILLNQIVVSISMASEGVIIPRLLISDGFSSAVSTGLFGKLTGMAEPISYFPLIFLAPLGSVLSPQVSSAFKTKDFVRIKSKISLFYLTSTVLCLASFIWILFTAEPLSRFLYNDRSPTILIQLLVIGLPFTGIAILNISILAAVGATDTILLLSIWGAGLKAFALIILTPLLGIIGAAWAINITQIFNCLTSLHQVRRFLVKPGA